MAADKSNNKIVWFGMKVSPQEKEKIKKLAEKQGISQKEAVMNLVNDAIAEYEIEPQEGSMLAKMQKYIGVFDGPEDLSTNKKYLAGLGEDSTT